MDFLKLTFVFLLAGCGARVSGADGGSVLDGSVAQPDLANISDLAVVSDAATLTPEICNNNVDDDGDHKADCDDPDCWSGCAATHVAKVTPQLSECHTALVRSTSDEKSACTIIGTPTLSTPNTECDGEVTMTAQIRFFCNGAGETKAVWILEEASVPHSTVVQGNVATYTEYERSVGQDWDRFTFGAGSSANQGPTPLYEASVGTAPASATVVTVHQAQSSSSIERLLAFNRVVSTFDISTMKPTSETRTAFRVGATVVAVP